MVLNLLAVVSVFKLTMWDLYYNYMKYCDKRYLVLQFSPIS